MHGVQRCFRCAVRLVTAGLLVVAGCSGSGFQVAEVAGTVTLDGKPAPGVMLEFLPEPRGDVRLPPAYGFTDASGKYVVKRPKGKSGAVVGMHRVSFTRAEGGATAVPDHYAGEGAFDREVRPGSNTLDFALESKPRAR